MKQLISDGHAALRRTLQWRLLLLWLVALALPTALMVLPFFAVLNETLGRSLLSVELLQPLNPAVLLEALSGLGAQGWSPASGLPGLIVFVLLLPALNAMLVPVVRKEAASGFATLLQHALRDYGRMARLLLWGLVPLAAALGLGSVIVKAAGEQGQTLMLESNAKLIASAALVLLALLVLLANATLDAARARLAREPQRRSALAVIGAWFSATRDLVKQPRRLGLYALLTVFGLLLAALLGWARIAIAPVSGASFVADVLLVQLVALALVWMRAARVVALA